jgi:hypothetical protein
VFGQSDGDRQRGNHGNRNQSTEQFFPLHTDSPPIELGREPRLER